MLQGGEGDDYLVGGNDHDNLEGGAGNDTLVGGYGDDTLYGSTGDDVYIVDGDAVIELQGEGTDEVRTTSNYYQLGRWVENLTFIGTGNFEAVGHVGDEKITGGGGDDKLNGDSGNDTLVGGGGSDVLVGGGGSDTLTGGTESDTFVFGSVFGHDTVTDFQAGAGSEDALSFAISLFADFAAVLAASSQVGSDVVITAAANHAVILKNVQLSSLHADDFLFA